MDSFDTEGMRKENKPLLRIVESRFHPSFQDVNVRGKFIRTVYLVIVTQLLTMASIVAGFSNIQPIRQFYTWVMVIE